MARAPKTAPNLPPFRLVAPASLTPYKNNPRTHPPAQIEAIKRSIREFGFTLPVLVGPDGVILAGHGRVLAALALGMDEVPVIELGHLTEAQRRAYVIADNALAERSGWDDGLLKIELGAIQDMGFDLSLTGFTDLQITGFLAGKTAGNTDPDDVPEPQDVVVSRPGDIWLLGNHRLACGDSTDAAAVAALLAGAKPHLMVTDPPYGVEYEAGWRAGAMPEKNSTTRWKGEDGNRKGHVENDTRADWREAWALFPGDVAYVWHGALQTATVLASLSSVGMDARALIIWCKHQAVIGRGDYHNQHEPIWYAVRKGKTGHWAGDRKQTTVWNIDKPAKSETGHSTQKPVECMKRPIENNSRPGESVYEPFSGSGTTIIAAEMSGRLCYAMELSPAYVDLGARRWQDFTGEFAVLAATGQTFDEVAAARSRAAAE